MPCAGLLAASRGHGGKEKPRAGKPGAVQWEALRRLSAAAGHAPDLVQVGSKRGDVVVGGFYGRAKRCNVLE